MACEIEVLPPAESDLERLDGKMRNRILRRLIWLSENADQFDHYRLTGMASQFAGLCRFRVGDYRILYWYEDATLTV